MKYILFIALLLFCGIIHSQQKYKIFYANELGDYVILIDRTAKVQLQNLEDGYMETPLPHDCIVWFYIEEATIQQKL
jgi:hypothetical protein